MLILTCKQGESVIIGTDIAVKVVKVIGSTVKVGIVAPRTTRVNRADVHDRQVKDWKNIVAHEKEVEIQSEELGIA